MTSCPFVARAKQAHSVRGVHGWPDGDRPPDARVSTELMQVMISDAARLVVSLCTVVLLLLVRRPCF